MCCHTETEEAAQTCYFTQWQDIATGPANPSVDHKGARRQAGWPGEYQCVRHWTDWTWNRPLGESTGSPSPTTRPPKRSSFCALSRRETVHLPLPILSKEMVDMTWQFPKVEAVLAGFRVRRPELTNFTAPAISRVAQ